MKIKSNTKDIKSTSGNSTSNKKRNATNDSPDTIGSTRNYVSGDSAPSSLSHKFKDAERDSSNDSSL